VLRTDNRQGFADALIAQLPALRRYATALVGQAAAADDLVQDCIERALRQRDQLRDGQRLGGWLRSILYNLFVDDLRRRRGRGIEEDITSLADDCVLSVAADDRSEHSGFVAAMATLSAEHRQILLLVGLEGMNYREIAEELKVPIGTVMSRLARARERLRHALDDDATVEPSNVAVLAERRRVER
jgi:RNA polymerase sigma-70 factor (ECF subfamily)